MCYEECFGVCTSMFLVVCWVVGVDMLFLVCFFWLGFECGVGVWGWRQFVDIDVYLLGFEVIYFEYGYGGFFWRVCRECSEDYVEQGVDDGCVYGVMLCCEDSEEFIGK